MGLYKRIGIIAGKVYRDINQQQLCGILEQAYAVDFSASVFTLTEEYYDTRIDNAEYNILNLINFSRLDGIIYLPHTFASAACRELVHKFLEEKATIPVICADAGDDSFEAVWCDQRTESRCMVRHLIESHGCRKIYYMTGPENMLISHERLAGYKDAMEEAGLEYSDDDIIFGDFWVHTGKALAMELIDGVRPMPDAVACANDCMAISLCDSLMENGISVPDDIRIIGYDGTIAAAFHVPSVTTYQSAWKQLGARAMCTLYRAITGEETDEFQFEEGYVACGESCGCDSVNITGLVNSLNYEKVEGDYQDSSLSTTLLSSHSYKDFVHSLHMMEKLFLDFNDKEKMHYCLCLCEDWNQANISGYESVHRTAGYSDRIYATDTLDKHTVFPSANMLPEHIEKDIPSVTYFTPCHFLDRCFGYNTLTLYGTADSFELKYMRFCREVSNALAFLVMQDTVKSLAYSNQIAKSRDLLTGLYNLESFPQMWRDIADTAVLYGEKMYMIVISVGGLRQLEDVKGSLEKDKFLVAFSELLMKSCVGREKLLRIGDNDFAVIGSCKPDSEEYIKVIGRIEKKFNELSSMPSLYLRCAEKVLTDEEVSDTETTRNVMLEFADSLDCDQPSRTEQVYYRPLVILRREIYEFPGREWNLTLCSERLNISIAYFQKIYRKTFGVTCMHDIHKSKLDHAKRLLTYTNDTLQTISERCGYDYSHFMRMFKKEMGMTPTEYRKGKKKDSL
ncbi:MAG: substrate-binding domain-containing protein [Oscillospiraceae bacterium]|nr:substrate-binding domain-containing protein [Oscillospiraceae bacterium]